MSYAQAVRDLDVHQTMLRKWMKGFAADPRQAFPGHGQIKPEQLEIGRLRQARSEIVNFYEFVQ